MYWYGNEHSRASEFNLAELRKGCGNPTCTSPHLEVLRVGTGMAYIPSQVRAEQRCVVYRMPDGTVIEPETNHHDDPGAIEAVRRGAVRQEMYHIGDLRQLHQEHKRSPDDDWAQRNLVLDWDQPSISAGANHPIRQKIDRERNDTHNPFAPVEGRVGRMRLIYDGGDLYEKVRRERGRG